MTVTITPPTCHVRVPRTCHIRRSYGTVRVGSRRWAPAVWPSGNHDQLLIVRARTEEPLAEVRGAVVESVSFKHNGVGAINWSCSAWDDALDHLVDGATVIDGAGKIKLVGTEAQFWRNGVMYQAGPNVTAKVNPAGTIDFETPDLGWYLSRRFTGEAQRRDALHGRGSMDTAGLPGWLREGVTAVRSTTIKARGVGSAQVSGSGTLRTVFNHDAVGSGEDPTLSISAEVRVPSGTPVGTPILTVRAESSGGVVLGESVVVDDQTTFGQWMHISTAVTMRLGLAHQVTIDLWAITGDPWFYDDVRAQRNDTTGYPAPGVDLCTHAIAAMNHWQFVGSFNFHRRTQHLTGTVEPMGLRHLEHIDALDYLRTLTERDDGIDWWFDPRTRTFWVSNRRGYDHRHLALHSRTVKGGGWTHDITDLASRVVTRGDSDGVDAAEGGYQDTSRTAGLVLDRFHRMANGSKLADLDPTAHQQWEDYSQAQEVPDRITVGDEWLDLLQPGDTLPVRQAVGKVRMEDRIRINEMVLRPRAGSLELV